MSEVTVNRKPWIIAGIIVTALLVFGVVVVLLNRPAAGGSAPTQNVPVFNLAYCTEEQAKPCVVSFSTDANDNMLVNILLPDLSFPNFYLKITRGDDESLFNCRRIGAAVNTAYCSGAKLPPGETLHLELISVRDEILLAEGDLSIIGLAFPTVGVALVTVETVSAEATITATPTAFTDFILPPPESTPSPTPTLSSYPNTSYPNPSYP